MLYLCHDRTVLTGPSMRPTGPVSHSDRGSAPPRYLRVHEARLDLATHLVQRPAQPDVRLSPKAVQVLEALLRQQDRPVHREHLIAEVWAGQFRTDDVVTKAMQELRRAFGEGPGRPVIETIPRVGYWWRAPFSWEASDAGAEGAAVQVVAENAPRPDRGPAMWIVGVMVAASLAAALWLAGVLRPGSGPAKARIAAWAARPFSTDPGIERSAALAPDGTLAAIVLRPQGASRFRLYLRGFDGSSPRLLLPATLRGDELAPAWSPDGRRLAYFRVDAGECTLEWLDVLSPTPHTLGHCVPGNLRAPEFFPGGEALLLPWALLSARSNQAGMARIELEDGAISPFVLPPLPTTGALYARFAPDGHALLLQHGMPPFVSLTRIDFDGESAGAAHPLGERFTAIQGFTWLADSRHAVLASDLAGSMELWRIDTRTGALQAFGELSGEQPSAARSRNRLVYTRQECFSGLFGLAREGDGLGPPQPLFASTRSESAPALAPDGQTLAFVSERSGPPQLYLGDLRTGEVRPLTQLRSGRPFGLSFSPDGAQLLFAVRHRDRTRPWLLDVRTGQRREPALGVEQAMDLRFGLAPGELWYTGWGADARPFPYRQPLDRPQSAERMEPCSGRAPRPGPGGHLHLFSPEQRQLVARQPQSDGRWSCVAVNPLLRWYNHGAWIAAGEHLLAVLLPGDGVPVAGIYRLKPTPRLLQPLPDLVDSAIAAMVLVGNDDRVIASLPVQAQSDLWQVEDW